MSNCVMSGYWNMFRKKLDTILIPLLSKNIIIYGCNRGGIFLKTYLELYWNKSVKAIVDRWVLSPNEVVLHLYSLYYLYDENDVIINVSNEDIHEQFDDIGENWNDVLYYEDKIVNILELFYEKKTEKQLTYYEFLEYEFGVDLTQNISRKNVDGEDAHGYYPTDWSVLRDVFIDINISDEDAIFDFGCGKGAMMCIFEQVGFKRIGGVEFTEKIFETLIDNLSRLSISYSIKHSNQGSKILCINSDAGEIKEQLDDYNMFSLFNPFGMRKTVQVINNISESLLRKPRKIHIIYAEPMGHNVIMSTGLFDVEKKYKTDFYEGSYWTYVYSSKA